MPMFGRGSSKGRVMLRSARGMRMIGFAAMAASAFVTGCAKLTLAWADLDGRGREATPPALGPFEGAPPVTTPTAWREERAPRVARALQEHVYGVFPDVSETEILSKRTLDEAYLGGRGRLEEWRIRAHAGFGGAEPRFRDFNMVVLSPASAPENPPIILMQTFCQSHATVPHPDVSRFEFGPRCDGDGLGRDIMIFVFGRHIARPPLEEILDRGYALATMFASEIIPDAAEAGLKALDWFTDGHRDPATRWGAVGVWGWTYARMIDALEADPRFAASSMVAYGHSRFGKSALLAAAFDARVGGVIAHQSGTGGASLNRSKKGESIASIVKSYPHWFAPAYGAYGEDGGEAADAMPVDQHHLLALIAPRPVMLGAARRDVWSDPTGAFRAAKGADPVYELLGSDGLVQEDLRDFAPEADLAFFIRSGTHGVTADDWPAFFRFLGAHFPPKHRGATPSGDLRVD